MFFSRVCENQSWVHRHENLITKEEIQDSSCSNVYLRTSVTAGNVICSSLVFVKISLDYPGGIIDRVHWCLESPAGKLTSAKRILECLIMLWNVVFDFTDSMLWPSRMWHFRHYRSRVSTNNRDVYVVDWFMSLVNLGYLFDFATKSFSWHPVITFLCPSCKNCTGFPL